MSDGPKLLKDHFDDKAASALAEQIKTAFPGFAQDRFVKKATRGLASLELLARVDQFAEALAACLPADIPEALVILKRSLPPALNDCEALSVGWIQWPIGNFVAAYGRAYPEASLAFLMEFTQRFSAEFAIRPFADAEPEKTFAYLYSLLEHPNPHVRRWCSEGVRPRLPWGKRLHHLVCDPAPLWPILEALKDDPEPYVRRSIANHLNDIAKDHPEHVLSRCKEWGRNASPERLRLIKHALRTLIKDGHPEALALLGFAAPQKITATLEADKTTLTIGQSVELTATLSSSAAQEQPLLLDYIVHFVRKDGSTGAKTFKWTQFTLSPRDARTVRKKHPFKLTTIRPLYPGLHHIELQLNGQITAEAYCMLTPEC